MSPSRRLDEAYFSETPPSWHVRPHFFLIAIVNYYLGRNHTDGSELTLLCHDWCVICPKPITTHMCESLPPSVITLLFCKYQLIGKGPWCGFGCSKFISSLPWVVSKAMMWLLIPHDYFDNFCKLSMCAICGYCKYK